MSLASKITSAFTPTAKAQERAEAVAAAVDAVHGAERQLASYAEQIAAVSESITALSAEWDGLTIAALAEGPEAAAAQKRLDQTGAAIEAARKKLGVLHGAQRVAQRTLADARITQQRIATETQRKTMKRLADKRNAHADALAVAIGGAVKAYRGLVDASALVRTSYPAGLPPAGTLLDVGPLVAAVANEIYRQGSVIDPLGHAGPASFPGGKLSSETKQFAAMPEKIPSLVAMISDANGHLLRTLDGVVAQPMPTAATDDSLFVAAEPEPASTGTRTVAEVQAGIGKVRLTVDARK